MMACILTVSVGPASGNRIGGCGGGLCGPGTACCASDVARPGRPRSHRPASRGSSQGERHALPTSAHLEAAERLGVLPQRVRALAQAGELAAVRGGDLADRRRLARTTGIAERAGCDRLLGPPVVAGHRLGGNACPGRRQCAAAPHGSQGPLAPATATGRSRSRTVAGGGAQSCASGPRQCPPVAYSPAAGPRGAIRHHRGRHPWLRPDRG